jgi:CubicO group peptidase (beta-lactamase class C family)
MWIASCTKLVTAVAALQCIERGLFDFHSTADVERLLPEWSSLEVLSGFEDGVPQLQPSTTKMTLSHLFNTYKRCLLRLYSSLG